MHEQIAVDGEVVYIKQPMLHYSYRTSEDYCKKADSYTSLTAKFMEERHTKRTFGTWVQYMVWLPIKTFFLLFFRHKGFVDGWYGLVFAFWSARHFPIAYRKFITNLHS